LVNKLGRIPVIGVDPANLRGGQIDLVNPLFGEEIADGLLLGEI